MTESTLTTPARASVGRRVLGRAVGWLDRTVGWDKLPVPLGLLLLAGLRDVLRRENLVDTGGAPPPVAPFDPAALTSRTVDGSYNDLTCPAMGAARRRFGRNVSPGVGHSETSTLLRPNPRLVSRRLMTRTQFQPATTLNVLAATWIQFMVNDWLSHGPGDPASGHELPLEDGDPWPEQARPLVVPALVPDPTGGPDGLQTFINQNTAWWDASAIYGSDPASAAFIRDEGGRLKVSPSGQLAYPPDPGADPAMVPGFWVGLASMGAIFCLEHNAVRDALAAAYPHWGDEELFQRSRLVVSALIAKIHTVQWTPAVISHPTTVAALRTNWYGLAGERLHDAFGRVSRSELVSGIPGSSTDQFGVPYSLTEEFSIVYRMHPLIPDDYELRSRLDDTTLASYTLRDLTGPAGRDLLQQVNLGDVLYSFGTSHPGAIVLHNYPRLLQEFVRPDGKITDLAATDILRTRELGVPRYNEFRRQLHLKPFRDLADLTDDAETLAALRDLYDDVEQVDTIVGMFAERRPEGFAFSDTAFRIFILMASRRLNSDRFFTDYFNAEVYSQVGFRWIKENDFTSVLLRHFPELRPTLAGIANPFAPWRPARS